jgi:hypothetical protein
MSKKDRYSHLGDDADETSDDEVTAVDDEETVVDDEAVDESAETVDEELDDEDAGDPDEGVEDDLDDVVTDESEDGTIRVTISDGDTEHEVVLDSEAGVTTDDVVRAVRQAGREDTTPKTVWGRWMQMVSSLGKARLAVATVVGVVAVKALTTVARRFRGD